MKEREYIFRKRETGGKLHAWASSERAARHRYKLDPRLWDKVSPPPKPRKESANPPPAQNGGA